MSTKELLIRHLDDLNETQQKSLLMFLLSDCEYCVRKAGIVC